MRMREALVGCSMLAGLALAAQPGFAANPFSNHASNLPTSNITSRIAPALPPTGLGPNATVSQNIQVASTALAQGKTGLAQNALENAETLALTRSVAAGASTTPDNSTLVSNLSQARDALGKGDLAGAKHFTDLAMQEAGSS